MVIDETVAVGPALVIRAWLVRLPNPENGFVAYSEPAKALNVFVVLVMSWWSARCNIFETIHSSEEINFLPTTYRNVESV